MFQISAGCIPPNALGNAFDLFIGEPVYLSYFPNGRPRLQKDLAGYHGRALIAVFFEHILQNIIPLIPRKIHINIRHIPTFRMDKSFKLKCVLQRIHLCDKKAITHHRCRCGSPANGGTGLVYNILNNEKIGREPFLGDDAQFIFDSAAYRFIDPAIAHLGAGINLISQLSVGVMGVFQ